MILFKRNRYFTMLVAIGISGSGKVLAAPADQGAAEEGLEATRV